MSRRNAVGARRRLGRLGHGQRYLTIDARDQESENSGKNSKDTAGLVSYGLGMTPRRDHRAQSDPGRQRTLQTVVAEAIRAAGTRGMTDDELAVALGIGISSVNARRRELVLKNVVTDSRRRRPTRTGRAAIVWVARGPHRLRRG